MSPPPFFKRLEKLGHHTESNAGVLESGAEAQNSHLLLAAGEIHSWVILLCSRLLLPASVAMWLIDVLAGLHSPARSLSIIIPTLVYGIGGALDQFAELWFSLGIFTSVGVDPRLAERQGNIYIVYSVFHLSGLIFVLVGLFLLSNLKALKREDSENGFKATVMDPVVSAILLVVLTPFMRASLRFRTSRCILIIFTTVFVMAWQLGTPLDSIIQEASVSYRDLLILCWAFANVALFLLMHVITFVHDARMRKDGKHEIMLMKWMFAGAPGDDISYSA